jgi:hypothetical protein
VQENAFMEEPFTDIEAFVERDPATGPVAGLRTA